MCFLRITVTKNKLYWCHGYLLVQTADQIQTADWIQNVDCRVGTKYVDWEFEVFLVPSASARRHQCACKSVKNWISFSCSAKNDVILTRFHWGFPYVILGDPRWLVIWIEEQMHTSRNVQVTMSIYNRPVFGIARARKRYSAPIAFEYEHTRDFRYQWIPERNSNS